VFAVENIFLQTTVRTEKIFTLEFSMLKHETIPTAVDTAAQPNTINSV
jgi:hypothetical protein